MQLLTLRVYVRHWFRVARRVRFDVAYFYVTVPRSGRLGRGSGWGGASSLLTAWFSHRQAERCVISDEQSAVVFAATFVSIVQQVPGPANGELAECILETVDNGVGRFAVLDCLENVTAGQQSVIVLHLPLVRK